MDEDENTGDAPVVEVVDEAPEVDAGDQTVIVTVPDPVADAPGGDFEEGMTIGILAAKVAQHDEDIAELRSAVAGAQITADIAAEIATDAQEEAPAVAAAVIEATDIETDEETGDEELDPPAVAPKSSGAHWLFAPNPFKRDKD